MSEIRVGNRVRFEGRTHRVEATFKRKMYKLPKVRCAFLTDPFRPGWVEISKLEKIENGSNRHRD